MRHKDGHWVWILDRGRVMTHDTEGRPLEMFGTHADITALKEAEQALRHSEAQFRALYEDSPFGILVCELIVDDEGTPVDFVHMQANEAVAVHTGLALDKTVGRRASEMVPPEELARLLKTYGDVVATGEPASYSQHFPIYGKTLDVTAFALHARSFIINFIDVSDRIRAEKELAQHHEHLEEEVRERTRELRVMVNAMAGREVRMAELKEEIKELKRRREE